jgi:hypothetical protein
MKHVGLIGQAVRLMPLSQLRLCTHHGEVSMPNDLAARRLSAGSLAENLTTEIQDALAALADVELRYETDRERLDQWSGPEPVKTCLLEQVEDARRRAREPLLRRLVELQSRAARHWSAATAIGQARMRNYP